MERLSGVPGDYDRPKQNASWKRALTGAAMIAAGFGADQGQRMDNPGELRPPAASTAGPRPRNPDHVTGAVAEASVSDLFAKDQLTHNEVQRIAGALTAEWIRTGRVRRYYGSPDRFREAIRSDYMSLRHGDRFGELQDFDLGMEQALEDASHDAIRTSDSLAGVRLMELRSPWEGVVTAVSCNDPSLAITIIQGNSAWDAFFFHATSGDSAEAMPAHMLVRSASEDVRTEMIARYRRYQRRKESLLEQRANTLADRFLNHELSREDHDRELAAIRRTRQHLASFGRALNQQ